MELSFKVYVPCKKVDQFLFDVFVTGIEGGINYWCAVEDYHTELKVKKVPRNAKGMGNAKLAESIGLDSLNDLAGFRAKIKDVDRPRSKSIIIDRNVILLGIKRALKKNNGLSDAIKHALTDGDAGDIDASDADNIIQLGIFGKLTYA
jgi:hypothetical protein